MGPATQEVVKSILTSRPHPEQGFRACLGILRLGKSYGPDRLEAACGRAILLKSFSYKSIESILKTGLDRRPLPTEAAPALSVEHENIRGPHYYQ
jgi:transposase